MGSANLAIQSGAASTYSAACAGLSIAASLSGVPFRPALSKKGVESAVLKASGVQWDPIKKAATELRASKGHHENAKSKGFNLAEFVEDVAEETIAEALADMGSWLVSLMTNRDNAADSACHCADSMKSIMDTTNTASQTIATMSMGALQAALPVLFAAPLPVKRAIVAEIGTILNAAGAALIATLASRDQSLRQVYGLLTGHLTVAVGECTPACVPSCGEGSSEGKHPARGENQPSGSVHQCEVPPSPHQCEKPAQPAQCEDSPVATKPPQCTELQEVREPNKSTRCAEPQAPSKPPHCEDIPAASKPAPCPEPQAPAPSKPESPQSEEPAQPEPPHCEQPAKPMQPVRTEAPTTPSIPTCEPPTTPTVVPHDSIPVPEPPIQPQIEEPSLQPQPEVPAPPPAVGSFGEAEGLSINADITVNLDANSELGIAAESADDCPPLEAEAEPEPEKPAAEAPPAAPEAPLPPTELPPPAQPEAPAVPSEGSVGSPPAPPAPPAPELPSSPGIPDATPEAPEVPDVQEPSEPIKVEETPQEAEPSEPHEEKKPEPIAHTGSDFAATGSGITLESAGQW